MENIISTISFDVQLSQNEIEAIKRILSGNKVKFEVLKDAQLMVKIRVKVKDGRK